MSADKKTEDKKTEDKKTEDKKTEDKKTGEKVDSSEAIARLERLACLQLPDNLRTEMEAKTFTLVAGWFDKIRELESDTRGKEPVVNTREFHKGTKEEVLRETWREDVANANAKREDLLANAPESEHGLFTVPKVLE